MLRSERTASSLERVWNDPDYIKGERDFHLSLRHGPRNPDGTYGPLHFHEVR